MENKGIITKINGNIATINLYKSSSCSHCSCCSEQGKIGSKFEFKIDQKVELGDLVTLEIAEKEVLKAAIVAYIMPPIFMILGYLITNYLKFSEGESILGSFVGLAFAFFILKIYDKFFVKKTVEEKIKVVAIEKYDPKVCTNLGEHCEDFF